ncbi:MAG: response regulator [Deltaproteobacteria bacterium]|nr:response regulator [Deltaproteobacteria bacterium]
MLDDLQKVVILVIDDEPMILKMLSRTLSRKFGKVLTAQTIEEAEKLLAENEVTHLICDCNLSTDRPRSIDLIPGWCAQYPSIIRTVLFPGSDFVKENIPKEVDYVIAKNQGHERLVQTLL